MSSQCPRCGAPTDRGYCPLCERRDLERLAEELEKKVREKR